MAFTGKLVFLLSSFIALTVHELSHYYAAKKRGFIPDGINLNLFGATMSYDCGLSDKDEFFVTLFGPLSNLISCLVCAALWWFFPRTYGITHAFFRASFALAVFNLIPVFPFDGGRILLSLIKNKLRFLKIARVIGFVIASLFLIGGIYSAVCGYGYTLIFASAVVFWSNIFDAPKERYRIIFSSHGIFSSPFSPYEIREVRVDGRAKTGELLRFISRKGVKWRVTVICEKKEVLLTEENLEKLFYKNRKAPLSETISTLF